MEATLGEIKEYCEVHNIKIKVSEENNEIDLYGNSTTEAYFNYYIEHRNEINKWLASKKEIKK